MSFSLSKVVPWGRSLAEYTAMFSLSETDLQQTILGCGDGPASFNAELTQRGGRVISVDPLYQFPARSIKARIDETYDLVMAQTAQNQDEFVWTHVTSLEMLGAIRKAAMDRFLGDYRINTNRYIPAELPHLPFDDKRFGLALCSHFLFLYSSHLSFEFHISSLVELARVAKEVRVFPLLELGARKSRHLDAVLSTLDDRGYHIGIKRVAYEFQKGGDQMVSIQPPPSIIREIQHRQGLT